MILADGSSPIENSAPSLTKNHHVNLISRQEFTRRLNDDWVFQWPLKPYGVTDQSSLAKTAVVNKGAETRLYMNLLEQHGLYDRRNPAGPLPTSLRPQLNALLQKEGVSAEAAYQIYSLAFCSRSGRASLVGQDEDSSCPVDLSTIFVNNQANDDNGTTPSVEALDYYDFVKMLGEKSISWED